MRERFRGQNPLDRGKRRGPSKMGPQVKGREGEVKEVPGFEVPRNWAGKGARHSPREREG